MANVREVRWPATVEQWNRRKTTLGAGAAVALAIVALADPLGQQWLKLSGLVAALLVGVAIAALEIAKSRLEDRREAAEWARRFRAQAPIAKIDPTLIGVDAAPPTALGEGVPEYVPRGVDDKLRAVVEAALVTRDDDGGAWLVVVSGPSKVGKSRSLFEALKTCSKAGELALVAPRDADAVRALLDPGQTPTTPRSGCAVLWLDDLEPFTAQGMTIKDLREWRDSRPGWIVAATYGGKGGDEVAANGTLHTLAGDILARASKIGMTETTEREIDPLLVRLTDDELALVRGHGLAAYLVAGDALRDKLTTRRHAGDKQECPEGVAVVRGVVDWARCGRADPIDEDTLHTLWPGFLPLGVSPAPEGFAAGLKWALRPVAARIALLLEPAPDCYQAYDYVTRLVGEARDLGTPSGVVWAAAIDSATPEQALQVGISAYRHDRLEDASAAFDRAADSTNPLIKALAWMNRGIALGVGGICLVSEDTAGNIAVDDLDTVTEAFAALMRQFDADPEKGVDLAEAADTAATVRVIAQNWAFKLCDAMAEETADILRGYPELPADAIERLDADLERLGFGWPASAGPEMINVAKAIVRQSLHGADTLNEGDDAPSVRVMHMGDPLVQLDCLKCVFAACCTLLARAKGF